MKSSLGPQGRHWRTADASVKQAVGFRGRTGRNPKCHGRAGEGRRPLPSPCPPGPLCPRLKVTQLCHLSGRQLWERLSSSALSPPPWDPWRQAQGCRPGEGRSRPRQLVEAERSGGLGLGHRGAARSCHQSPGCDSGASLGMRARSRRRRRAVPGAEAARRAGPGRSAGPPRREPSFLGRCRLWFCLEFTDYGGQDPSCSACPQRCVSL